MRILGGQYQPTKLYIRMGFSSPVQAPFFLTCTSDSVGAVYHMHIMPRPGVYCHEIQAVRAFHLKFKARLSWNTAVLEIFAMEFNCVGNHFLEEFFSEIS